MACTLNNVIARLLALEVRLLACRERLLAQTDPEALHDLRTAVRRLRSLLRPLRTWPGVAPLEAAAKAVGGLTTPWRDREVLAAYLSRRGHSAAAARRVQQMHGVYTQAAQAPQLDEVLRLLAALPAFLRAAQRHKVLEKPRRQLTRQIEKQWNKLTKALADPAHDRHRLRLLIKRVRYGAEAYPELDKSPEQVTRALKKAQDALGDWHDHFQWLHQAQQEVDLASCVAQWNAGLHRTEAKSDVALERLQKACAAA